MVGGDKYHGKRKKKKLGTLECQTGFRIEWGDQGRLYIGHI